MDNLCTALLTVAEAITPLASSYANLKGEASEYLNATTLLTSMLLPVIHKSLKQLLLHPLQSILASHNELKNRIEDRNRAQTEYDIACIELQKLQKKVVSTKKKMNSNNNYENNNYQPNDPKSLAAQAKVVSKLTSSQALITALSEALTDELRTLSTRRKEVVTRLFLGITSILQTFTFGSAASFMDCDFSPILQSLQTLAEENKEEVVPKLLTNNVNTLTTNTGEFSSNPSLTKSTETNTEKGTSTASASSSIAATPPNIPTSVENTDELSTVNTTTATTTTTTSGSLLTVSTTSTTTDTSIAPTAPIVLNRASSPIAFALAAISSVVSPLTSSTVPSDTNKIHLPPLSYHTDKLDTMVSNWMTGIAWWDEGKASRNNAKAAYSRKRAAQRKLFEVTGIQRRIPLSAYLVSVPDNSNVDNNGTTNGTNMENNLALSPNSSTVLTLQRPTNVSTREIILQNIVWQTYLAQYITLPDLIHTSQLSRTLSPLILENSAPWLALLTAGGLRISYSSPQNDYYRALRIRFWLRCLGSDNHGAPAMYSLVGLYRRKSGGANPSLMNNQFSSSSIGFIPSDASALSSAEIPALNDGWIKPINEDSLQALLQLAKAESAIGGKGEGVPTIDPTDEGSHSDNGNYSNDDIPDEQNVVRWLTLIEQDVTRSYTEGVPFGISGAILRARKAAMKDRTVPLKALLENDEESVFILRKNAHRRLTDELLGNYKYSQQHQRSYTYRRRNLRIHRRRSLPCIPSSVHPVTPTVPPSVETTVAENANDKHTVSETVPTVSHNPYMNPYAAVIPASSMMHQYPHNPLPTVQYRSNIEPSANVYGAQYSFAHVIETDSSAISSSSTTDTSLHNNHTHELSEESLSPTEPPVSISLSAFLGGQVVTPSAYAAAAMARKGTASRRTKEEESSRGKLRRSSAFACYGNYSSSSASSTESINSHGNEESNGNGTVRTTVENSVPPNQDKNDGTNSSSNEDNSNNINIEGTMEWVSNRRQYLHQVLLALAASEPDLRYTQGMNAVSRMLLEIAIQGGSHQPVLDTVNMMRALLDSGSRYHDQHANTMLDILRDNNKRIQTIKNTLNNSTTSSSSSSVIFTNTNLPPSILYYVASPRLRSLFAPDMVHLRLRIYQVDRLLLRRSPELHAHFASEGIQCSTFAAPWLLTLFTNFTALDASSTAAVWDKFLIEGWAPILRMCLAVLATLAPLLLDATMEDCLPALHAPRLYYSSISSSWIISPSSRRRYPHTGTGTNQDPDDYENDEEFDHPPEFLTPLTSSTGAATLLYGPHQYPSNGNGTTLGNNNNHVSENIIMEQLLYRMDNDPLCSVTSNDLIDLEIDYYTYGDRYTI